MFVYVLAVVAFISARIRSINDGFRANLTKQTKIVMQVLCKSGENERIYRVYTFFHDLNRLWVKNPKDGKVIGQARKAGNH